VNRKVVRWPFSVPILVKPQDADLEVRLAALREELPFDPLDFIKFNMPDALKVTQKVNAVD